MVAARLRCHRLRAQGREVGSVGSRFGRRNRQRVGLAGGPGRCWDGDGVAEGGGMPVGVGEGMREVWEERVDEVGVGVRGDTDEAASRVVVATG